MVKIIAVLFLAILFVATFAGAQQADTTETYWDWLGSGPVYRYGDVILPYYQYYYPAYSYTPPGYPTRQTYIDTLWHYPWSYLDPNYYYQPYFFQKYPVNARWIGTHEDLQKTIAIARTGSSVRIYSNGFWRTP